MVEGARIVIEKKGVFGNVLLSVSPALPFMQRSFERGIRVRGPKSNAFECLFYKGLPCLWDKQIRTEIGNLGIDKDRHICKRGGKRQINSRR